MNALVGRTTRCIFYLGASLSGVFGAGASRLGCLRSGSMHPVVQPPAATFRCSPQAPKSLHPLDTAAAKKKSCSNAETCSGKEAPEDYSSINALGGRTTRCIFRLRASLAGVSELALGVAYRHIWRWRGWYGECTINSAISLRHKERCRSINKPSTCYQQKRIGVSTSLLQFKAPDYAAVVFESLPLHRTYPEPIV